MLDKPGHFRRHRWRLPLAFAGIAVLFAAAQLICWRKAAGVRDETQKIVTNMVASIDLVSRMSRDVDTERFLADEHILESEEPEHRRVAAEVARAEADFATVAVQYEPIATLPGESLMWQRVKRGVAALEPPRAQALELSRANRDAEARAAMLALDRRFAAIGDDMNDLIQINRRGAERSLSKIEELQRSTSTLLALLTLVGIVSTLAVGAWTTRLVFRHDEELTGYSSLLEQQNRELDAFAGRVAHDLRAPLGTVSLSASMLSRKHGPEDKPVMDRILRGVTRMEALIRDLLALSRVGLELEGETCDPAATAEALREELVAQHASAGARVRVEVEPARIRGKTELLRQVLWNLADNAVKYRRDGVTPEVAVVGRVAGGGYELRVSDNGVGMVPEDARHMFDPFYRAERTRDRPGTGLGMSIVKRIVEASGGSVSVDSQLGRGTTVVLALPLASQVAPVARDQGSDSHSPS